MAHPDQFNQKKGAHAVANIRATFDSLHQKGELQTQRFFADTARHLVPHLVPRPEEI